MAGKKVETGPTGAAAAENIARLREAQRITYAELSRILGDAGRPIPPLGLRRIESGERRIDVDDLVAIASALGSSPITLLAPDTETADALVEVTGVAENPVASETLWKWLRAESPISGEYEDLSQWMDWVKASAPSWRVRQATEGALHMLEIRRAELQAEAGDRTALDALLAASEADNRGDD
ncbi:helix-turn-helix domain-containing protein [Gordonia hongkongensis]|uniref:helix-turn-helix domain-containing protein n=1 Tax=Gordonia hongkongensis TaxID=1701090 RepID=UPI003D73EB2C